MNIEKRLYESETKGKRSFCANNQSEMAKIERKESAQKNVNEPRDGEKCPRSSFIRMDSSSSSYFKSEKIENLKFDDQTSPPKTCAQASFKQVQVKKSNNRARKEEVENESSETILERRKQTKERGGLNEKSSQRSVGRSTKGKTKQLKRSELV